MKKEETSHNGFHFTWAIALTLITVIVITVFSSYYFGLLKKTCEDNECFNTALQKCSLAKYTTVHNYNYYTYSIEGKSKGNCLLNIKLAKMAAGSPPEKIAQFEGKGMDCKVPIDETQAVTADTIENILKYCTGPLKEAMYEQIIEKLYTLVVGNMGDILGDIETTLRKGAP